MPDLNDLGFFAAVVEKGGFSAAGRALGIPKSRISRRVAALEDQLGVRLVERSTRRFSVTDLGQDVYRHARAALAEAEAIEEVISRATAEPQGLVRVSCPPGTDRLLAGCLPFFLARYPKLKLQFLVSNRPVDLIADGIDIAVRVRERLDTDAEMQVKIIERTSSVLVASPELLALQGTPAEPQDLARFPTLALGERPGPVRWALCNATGASEEVWHEPRVTASSFPILRESALGGVGLALLPEYATRDFIEAGRLVRVLPEWDVPDGILHLIFTSRRGVLPGVRVTLDFLAQTLKSGSPAWEAEGALVL